VIEAASGLHRRKRDVGGSPAPVMVLGALGTEAALAFDLSGDLSAATSNSLVEFTRSQLAANGAPAPAVTSEQWHWEHA
jgi:hypothetical protein